MAVALRQLKAPRLALAGTAALLGLWVLPLVAGLAAILLAAGDGASWGALFAHPQLVQGLTLSVLTGTLSAGLALLLALLVVAGLWQRPAAWLGRAAGSFMALPHFTFAVGLAFVLAPTGILARLVAPFAGWSVPPGWVTVQDRFGLMLIAVLVLKEAPFLIWLMWSGLNRADFAREVEGYLRVGTSLGHGRDSVWLRVIAPLLLQRLRWPLVIVWFYGASVVDVALAVGPTTPPTLAVIAWTDLNNADALINSRGTLAAVVLTLVLIVLAVLAFLVVRLSRPWWRAVLVRGPSLAGAGSRLAAMVFGALCLTYAVVFATLLILSFAGWWPFPRLWPTSLVWQAWHTVAQSPEALATSLVLAAATSLSAVGLALCWLEALPEAWDRLIIVVAVAALTLPALLIADGQYMAFLRLGLGGRGLSVFLGQFTSVFAYVFLVMRSPYRAFDPRYALVAHSLGRSDRDYLLHIKLPVLKPVLAAALAVGVGVSIAQYVPSQLLGAGRIVTLATEAVNLATGGNRPLLACHALLLAIIPALGFSLAARTAGQAR
jgi:putative thiamine transport system permease protein